MKTQNKVKTFQNIKTTKGMSIKLFNYKLLSIKL